MTSRALPSLPLAEWEETKTTLHLMSQIVGKVRLVLSPPVNHWWHAPLYVSARGLTTSAIPTRSGAIELELDLCNHELVLRATDAPSRRIALAGGTIASFHRAVREALATLGVRPRFVPRPFDPSRVKSDIPFAKDETHGAYDPEYAARFRRILAAVDGVFREFRGEFIGKSSPVHFFWHSFDLAVTRFSGRAADVPADADPVTREAYSHEVISAGFWVGDDQVPEPAFYTYAAPEPPGLANEPLEPASASWQAANGSHMALLRYEDVRTADDPEGELLRFLHSAYAAGARRASWPGSLTK